MNQPLPPGAPVKPGATIKTGTPGMPLAPAKSKIANEFGLASSKVFSR